MDLLPKGNTPRCTDITYIFRRSVDQTPFFLLSFLTPTPHVPLQLGGGHIPPTYSFSAPSALLNLCLFLSLLLQRELLWGGTSSRLIPEHMASVVPAPVGWGGQGRGERSPSVRLTWGPRDPDARFRVQLCHGWLVTGGASRIVSLSPSFPTCQNLFPESLLRLKETIYMKCPFPGFTSRWPYTTEINSSFK